MRTRTRGFKGGAMKHAYTWGAILVVVLASTTGDVLLSRAMKKVGDVENSGAAPDWSRWSGAFCGVPASCWVFS